MHTFSSQKYRNYKLHTIQNREHIKFEQVKVHKLQNTENPSFSTESKVVHLPSLTVLLQFINFFAVDWNVVKCVWANELPVFVVWPEGKKRATQFLRGPSVCSAKIGHLTRQLRDTSISICMIAELQPGKWVKLWKLQFPRCPDGHERGELHCVVSLKSLWLFPPCQGHQKPVNDTRDMSGIPHTCLGCVSHVNSLWTVKLMLSKAKFSLKKVILSKQDYKTWFLAIRKQDS